MKTLRIALVTLILSTLLPGLATAKAFYCTNCSTSLLQKLERATGLDQLNSLVKQYGQTVIQTEQQIRMVQQNIEQYANMVQNTIQLPKQLVNELKGHMTRLAQLTGQLKTLRGDTTSMGELFTQMFPEQGSLRDLAGASSPQDVAAAAQQYRQHYDTWSQEVDRAAQAAFQLSGQQLEDFQQDSEGFQSYLDDLLSTPEGQMQAAMAGNQLAALQIQETRQLRELMATNIQAQLQRWMKEEKQSQMREEQWRDMTKIDKLNNLSSKPDPF